MRFALRTTKTLITRARGARYLPDLFNRLAELYVEQARYQYQLVLAQSTAKNTGGVVSVQTRLLKNQAIATYRRLLNLYPDYPDGDKVLFFMAHEMRELGDYDQMLRTYQDLADKYPKSEYRLEGLLVMGDYHFDRAQLDDAEKFYRMVLEGPETRVHAMARYKLGWCRINRADFKGALTLFEGSIRAAQTFFANKTTQTSGGAKIDLRREALVDSVFCFTEVYKPEKALDYFRQRADTKTTYLAALDKLGNRYYVRQNWVSAAMVYREILTLSGDLEDAVEYANRLYEAVTNGKLYRDGAQDVEALVSVIRRRYYNAALAEKERAQLYRAFEGYTRYIATQMQQLATEKKDEELYLKAARANEAYLSFFATSKHAPAIRGNLADALYSAKRQLAAGREYERSATTQRGDERRVSVYTAVVAYFDALKGTEKLSRLDVEQARAGLRRAGELYLREFPRGDNAREVKFNIARTYYDAGDFNQAIRLFTAFVDEFTRSREATVAAHLVLDSYRNQEDFEGLIVTGKRLQRLADLGDAAFRGELAAIVQGAEENLLRAETIKAGEEQGDAEGTAQLEQIAETYKGTTLGKKALLNAFVAARNSRDPEKVFEVGEKLRRAYPNAEELPDVLSTMGKIALDSLQFTRGAGYLEAAARFRQGKAAADLHLAAGQIRAGLGDRNHAEQNLNVLLRLPVTPTQKAELAVRIARLHVDASDWGSVVGLLQRAQGAGAASPDLSYLLGYALFRQDQLAPAQQQLQDAAVNGGAGNDADREAAAAAQLYLGEITYKAFEAAQLSSDLSQLGATLQQKLGLMAQARQAYTGVGALGSGTWTVAALGRLAAVDEAAALALRELPLPPDLPPDAAKQVRQALAAQAAPLEAEAKQAIAQCAAAARRLKVLSPAAQACLAGRAPSGDPQTRSATVSAQQVTPSGSRELQLKLAQQPNDAAAIEQLGTLYLAAGDPYMAQLIFSKGLELRETASLLNLLAAAQARLGNPQEAYALLSKALKLDPSHRAARVNRAALLISFGYKSDAQTDLRAVPNLGALSDSDPALIPDALRIVGGSA
ncbi:MAG: tetratricopeptide repeat protein [Proteobacteria bacterium]|nr:tetratricopeptide repeat protein [Pseudomonadota bacterium]